MSKARFKKRMKVEPSRKDLKRCQLKENTIQDETGNVVYRPGSNFYCEQKYDKKGQAYMRVYLTEDAESYWPFSLPEFYHLFIILR